MERVNENHGIWDTLPVQVLRWIILIPLCLGLLWLFEVIAQFVVDGVVSWRLGTVFQFIVFILSGLVFFLVLLVIGKGIEALTASLAPHARIGMVLVVLAYVVVQVRGLNTLLFDPEATWANILAKFEFTAVVSVMLLLAYRRTSGEGPE